MVGPISSTAVIGMDRAVQTLDRAAQRGANPERALATAPRDAVDRSVAQHTYSANAAVLRTADEMLGTLIEIVG